MVEGNAKIFPLNANYSILMASGEMVGDNKGYHGDSRRYTGVDVDLTVRGGDTSGDRRLLGNVVGGCSANPFVSVCE